MQGQRNPIRVWDLDDGFTMMIDANAAAIILEVGYIRAAAGSRHRPRDAGQREVLEVR